MPKLNFEDTIAAIATPVGEGGLSVIRMSGPQAFEITQSVFLSSKNKKLNKFSSHTIHFGKIHDERKAAIDQVLLSVFKEPNSYTGEDVIEVSCHGGLAVTRSILNILLNKGARHAEPGEFTKRAFLNGKMDLTQAEAILDVIHAKSNRALDIAVRQLSGSLSKRLKTLKNNLMALLAHMEAYVDFPEEKLEINVDKKMKKQIDVSKKEIKELIDSFNKNIFIREGMLSTIVGKPNVGKSSLFNTLLERDHALVSELPNTTRDRLEESLEIKGFYIRLMDTAGLISTPGHPLDKLGMERTLTSVNESHLILFVVDGGAFLDEADAYVYSKIPKEKNVLVLINKSDLSSKMNLKKLEKITGRKKAIKISTKTRSGLVGVENYIAKFMEKQISGDGEQITKLRHKKALQDSLEFLIRAKESYIKKMSLEFVAADVRGALECLQELVGEVYNEDLLDVIFSKFCIGK